MQWIRDVLRAKVNTPCVATIGNFDGLHLAHREIISQVVALASKTGLSATLITFEPLPMLFLRPDRPVYRLTSLSEKIQILREWGITQVVCLRFNRALANLSSQRFIDSILIDALHVKHLIVGENFRFGYQRLGDIHLLANSASTGGFDLQTAPLKALNSERISSTLIRESLLAGDCEKAGKLLGRPYSLTRRVVRGAKRGQNWGSPTANIVLPREQQWLKGVFATRLEVEGKQYEAVTNCGSRPTVGGFQHVVESHLFDFSGDLYGKRVKVAFLHKLRDEQRFESIEALKVQIERDKEKARAFLMEKL